MSVFSQIKAVAFDLDGTLIDSVPDLAAATRAVLAELNLPLCTDEMVRTWVGNGAQMLMRRALSFALETAVSEEQLQTSMPRFMHFYKLNLQQHSVLYADVAAVLGQLKQAGYKMAIVTNKPYEFTIPLLESFELSQYFELVLGGDSLAKMKPDPLPLQHILHEWQLAPEQLLMVGDSKNDIIAAKAAKVASVGLTYGYNYGEDIGLSGPNAVCEQFSEITALLELRDNATEQ
ncbi:phosphoglycolate phosphatase [Shewanella fidelis]|uniref:Phosphoglycolate phosphatase n=1 Tax=Shewanella fidelis TaxID=173509 RepID=A0AAW8NTD9_9GAMM|nr:phosphoglycolate phosphatase [Shewanella fidelis]MDR8526092.1 phosphoglycolate phosphatase [Shewanella fidelis]MDW4813705.1 phosphoglycolate phosphatase [Shewanella fidelis]MDW4817801.1 phosphoglycolate phosphatase [Shewanella fidelis]MDW4821938.1 phosphoglycolate phosphatase [Shewanella fidelis]MDW4826033.1 phosphoglycolate phosphatase [Shewanella fidelis]